jgi:[ribosomal protein S18]-alanine N-acetyltransferase
LGLDIRTLQAADVDAIFALLKVIYDQPEYPMGGAWSHRLLETEIEAGRGLGLFAENRMAAFLLFREMGNIWEISLLATAVDCQRRGYMIGLLRKLVSQKPPDKEIWLEVHEGNKSARNLYKKLGFRQVGRRPSYYRDGFAAILYSL